MVRAFLCLLLDVFSLAAIEGAAARDRFPSVLTTPWRSRFTLLVALLSVGDLLP